MARKIVITSGKGGVGKTTVACNLAVQLAKRGLRVILCDFDFGLNNVDVALGVENLAVYDLLDAAEGKCRARQALVKHPRYPTLYTLSSNRAADRIVSAQAVRLVLDSLSPQFDFIVIDSPAGIEEGFHRAAACAEEAILVTSPHITAMRDADRVSGVLQSYRLKSVSLVVNLVKRDLSRKGSLFTADEIASTLRLPVLAVIPEDDRFYLGSIVERARGFRVLADAILAPREERKGIFATWGRKK